MSTPSTEQPKRRGLGCAVWAVAAVVVLIAIPWAWSSIQEANWAADSGTRAVEVGGALWGDDYEVADAGTIETWAEHSETAIYLDVTRTDSDSRYTPVLTAVLDGDAEVECRASRGYIWSTETGSQLTLLCDRYVELEDLQNVDLVLVQP